MLYVSNTMLQSNLISYQTTKSLNHEQYVPYAIMFLLGDVMSQQ